MTRKDLVGAFQLALMIAALAMVPDCLETALAPPPTFATQH